MSAKITEIMGLLKTLTLIEASELIKKIEEEFQVDASAPGPMMMGNMPNMAAAAVEVKEEKTEFTLVLEEVPADKKIAILKVVRTITGLGLKEAKDLVEAAPKNVKEGISKEIAETAKKQLEEAGAKVSLK
jgi:large subunit ribosomal protein L7/L12